MGYGHNQLLKVVLGVKFTDGIEEVRSQAQAAALDPLAFEKLVNFWIGEARVSLEIDARNLALISRQLASAQYPIRRR